MNRRYLLLSGAVLLGAVALAVVGRTPRVGRATAREAEPAPVAELRLDVRDGALEPARVTVEKDHDVHLYVTNHADRRIRLELSGYEDRVSVELAAGGQWQGTFLSDRPGDDFAWLLNGEPVGRLNVRGSHLIEGHR